MSRHNIKTGENIARYQQVTLLELLDRLLDKGVVVKGEILLSVADIDLVYLNLGLLLSSVKTVEQATKNNHNGEAESPEPGRGQAPPLPYDEAPRQAVQGRGGACPRPGHSDQLFEPRTTITPENVEKGLVKLVLTLVDLIRKLMEKQAVRRMDAQQLDAGDIEKLGTTFFLLEEKMEQLKKTFGLEDEDLNLNLGPLGDLL